MTRKKNIVRVPVEALERIWNDSKVRSPNGKTKWLSQPVGSMFETEPTLNIYYIPTEKAATADNARQLAKIKRLINKARAAKNATHTED